MLNDNNLDELTPDELRDHIEELDFKIMDLKREVDKYRTQMVKEGDLRAQFELENRRMLAEGLGTFSWLGDGDVLLFKCPSSLHHGTAAQMMERIRRHRKFELMVILPDGCEMVAADKKVLNERGLKMIEEMRST